MACEPAPMSACTILSLHLLCSSAGQPLQTDRLQLHLQRQLGLLGIVFLQK